MRLSIHVYLPNRRSERNTEVHFTRSPCIFPKFALEAEVRGSRFAPMTFPAWFPRTAKSSPKFSGDARVAQGARIDFLRRETKYSSISYSRATFCRSIQSPLFLSPSEYVCIRSKRVSRRCCYWTRSGCNYVTVLLSLTIDTRKRNVFSPKCQGGR